MGRYIPPSALDVGLSANQAAGKHHALGSRARKLAQGILTVRFEMPFHVWCGGCAQPTIIAQGVRFNAEKKRVGNYHSTPVWGFRMKHAACGGWLEVRTDPQRGEYVVWEGGKRRDYGEHKDEGVGAGLGEIVTEEERERRRNDAFAALEGKNRDKAQADAEKERIEELLEAKARDWDDPYAASQRVRRGFRAERKARMRKERERENVRERLGLGIELLDEDEGDRRRAGMVEFGDFGSLERDAGRAAARPLFGADVAAGGGAGSKKALLMDKHRTRVQAEAEKRKAMLQRELKGNTRAAMDPFLTDNDLSSPRGQGRAFPGLKRKQPGNANIIQSASRSNDLKSSLGVTDASTTLPETAVALVDYDSD